MHSKFQNTLYDSPLAMEEELGETDVTGSDHLPEVVAIEMTNEVGDDVCLSDVTSESQGEEESSEMSTIPESSENSAAAFKQMTLAAKTKGATGATATRRQTSTCCLLL